MPRWYRLASGIYTSNWRCSTLTLSGHRQAGIDRDTHPRASTGIDRDTHPRASTGAPTRGIDSDTHPGHRQRHPPGASTGTPTRRASTGTPTRGHRQRHPPGHRQGHPPDVAGFWRMDRGLDLPCLDPRKSWRRCCDKSPNVDDRSKPRRDNPGLESCPEGRRDDPRPLDQAEGNAGFGRDGHRSPAVLWARHGRVGHAAAASSRAKARARSGRRRTPRTGVAAPAASRARTNPNPFGHLSRGIDAPRSGSCHWDKTVACGGTRQVPK